MKQPAVGKTEFIGLIASHLNKGKKPADKITLETIRAVLDGMEDVIFQILSEGHKGVYGLHYPNLGKIQTVYVPETRRADPRTQKQIIKKAHYTVKSSLSPKIKKAPDLSMKYKQLNI